MAPTVSMLAALWESVFTPGTTPVLERATHASFVALVFVLLFMLIATKSLHFVALLVLAAGLWAAITWFIRESEALQQEAAKNSLKDVNLEDMDLPDRKNI